VFDQRDLFALVFGIIGCSLAVGVLVAGRLVTKLGLDRLIRIGACYVAGTALCVCVLVVASDGEPPMWAFILALAIMLPGVAGLVPMCNTAAMTPLPHVAGMAAAVLGTLSTGFGALLGAVVDSAFDNTVRPYGIAAFVFAAIAATVILRVATSVAPSTDPGWAADEPAPTD
jgi:DHA1 family bicyclomycin/chloramphenicol resistance-like MFS transporter